MSKPIRVQKMSGVQGIEKALALNAADAFCKTNGYSMQKLKEKRLYVFDEEAVFAAPRNVKPDGLKNDLETRPIPVLVLKYIEGDIVIEKTEYTDSFLK